MMPSKPGPAPRESSTTGSTAVASSCDTSEKKLASDTPTVERFRHPEVPAGAGVGAGGFASDTVVSVSLTSEALRGGEPGAGVARVSTESFFDAQELVVLRDALTRAGRAGLELPGPGSYREVGDEVVGSCAGGWPTTSATGSDLHPEIRVPGRRSR